MSRYDDTGEAWETYVHDRAERIMAHVPWDEVPVLPGRRKLAALQRAEREAQRLGLKPPTPQSLQQATAKGAALSDNA